MFYGNGYYMGGMHGLWWIFWLVLVGAVVFVIWGQRRTDRRRHRESPHQLLRRRLAAGDITPEEYEQRKALLDRDASE